MCKIIHEYKRHERNMRPKGNIEIHHNVSHIIIVLVFICNFFKN